MIVLVLLPGRRNLRWSLLPGNAAHPTMSGTIESYRARGALESLRRLQGALQAMSQGRPDLIAVRSLFGGEELPGPVRMDAAVEKRLEHLLRAAPLHVPGILEVARALPLVFQDTAATLVCETSFFVELPPRERTYAVEPGLASRLGLRRWGWHGLLHEAAAAEATRRWRAAGHDTPPRILSLCLEPRPELAGILGRRPLCVSSGATPLEGLPGETTCGELDPSVALALSRDAGLGPEATNAILTTESGLSGLAARPVRLGEVLDGRSRELQQERRLLMYRIVLSCGAALAALGGADVLVFSGRYFSAGYALGPELIATLARSGAVCPETLRTEFMTDDIATVVAAAALTAPTP